MARRGPDAAGEWWSNDGCAGLGHRRLAIIDLDARANQPMRSADGRYVIAFNGEIYNFRELRAELEAEGVAFTTTSDTEVLLALFGREQAAMLPRLRGMFAFAIWDNTKRQMFVARDPYGIKPLYIATTSNGVLIASQVKALLATDLVARNPDPVGQAGFWLLGSVPEPHTWFRDIRVLPAGHYAVLTSEGASSTICWWDIGQAWRENAEAMPPNAEIQEHVRAALHASVNAHLVADVPVGVFLSGGIDSGSLAALMLEAGASDLQGITLTFNEFAGRHEDEAPLAARLAHQFGMKHHVRIVTREEFEVDLPRIFAAMDQPSIDGINTWYATKAVAELGLKVVVSGVGGDELFQGYSSFSQLPRLISFWRGISRLPGGVSLARLICAWQARHSGNMRWRLLPDLSNSMAGVWFLSRGLFAPEELPALMGEDTAAQYLHDFDPVIMVDAMVGQVSENQRLALGQIESMTYLRNQLLRDSDWASMDHSVELRTPLVDAWLLRDVQPFLGGFHNFSNKRLLAEAPNMPLPEELIVRKKTGFGIPVQRWLMEMGYSDPRDGMSRGWARQLTKDIYGKY